jgi:hypothetical protein
MKVKILFLFLAFLAVLPVKQAQAHVLKTDGSIGAVIHVSPEDDPIAGESTDFFFEIKDKSSKFNPQNCDCNGVVIQGGKEVYSTPLFQGNTNPNLENASFSFTFPEKDVYKVRITGKPTSNDFKPFNLTWDIRVARESETQPTGTDGSTVTTENKKTNWISQNGIRIVGALLVISFIIYFIKNQLTKKRNS